MTGVCLHEDRFFEAMRRTGARDVVGIEPKFNALNVEAVKIFASSGPYSAWVSWRSKR